MRPRPKMRGTSYRLNGTYVKAGKEWKYLSVRSLPILEMSMENRAHFQETDGGVQKKSR
jgi:hypothetical protein